MRWQWFVVAAAVICGVNAPVPAGGLALSLKLESGRVITAEPVVVVIGWQNGTDAPVSLSTYDGQGFRRSIVFRKPDGALASALWPSSAMPMRPLAPGESASFQEAFNEVEVGLLKDPGHYELWAEYESPGRVYEEGQVFGQPTRFVDYWKGAVRSNVCEFEVLQPTGSDLDAYDHYKGQPMAARDLLQNFPTSTYAAYVVWRMTGARGTAVSDPAKLAEALRGGRLTVARSVVCPPGAGCDPHEKVVGQNSPEQAIERSARWIDIVLKAHPDIWFADELRLRIALDEIIEGKSAAGAGGLEALAKSGRPDIAEKAGRLLTLIKEKGLVQ